MNTGLLGSSMNMIRFGYNNFLNWDILLVLDSLSFTADGIHNLDNQCPVLPFDYAGQGLVDDAYVEGTYDENSFDFASWRLSCGSLYYKWFE